MSGKGLRRDDLTLPSALQIMLFAEYGGKGFGTRTSGQFRERNF
jgi:hypothetical protein